MPNEMNHADLALKLAHLAFDLDNSLSTDDMHVLTQAATDERRIASGELMEVVHAHWKHRYRENGWPYCSNCEIDALEGGDEEPVESAHCPSCGALMDGKDDKHAE